MRAGTIFPVTMCALPRRTFQRSLKFLETFCHHVTHRCVDVKWMCPSYNPFSLDTKEFSIGHVHGNIGPRANKVIQQTMTFDDSDDRCDSCGAHTPCMPMDRGQWLLPSAIPPTCVPGGCVHCNYHPGGMAVGKPLHSVAHRWVTLGSPCMAK